MAKTFTEISKQLNEFRELAGKSIGSIAAAVGRGIGRGALSLAGTVARGAAAQIGVDTSAIEGAFGAGKQSAKKRLSDEDRFIDLLTHCKIDGRVIATNVSNARSALVRANRTGNAVSIDNAQEQLEAALRQQELFNIRCDAVKKAGGNAVKATTLIKKAEADFARRP